MNDTIQQLFDRKSVRAFSDQPITEQERELILQAAAQAPTAGNMSLYSIIDVRDPELKALLAERCDHQPFISEAPLVLLFLVDWQKWADLFGQMGMPVDQVVEADLLLGAQDCMAAAQNAVVAAESLGIGSCYIGDILEHVEENRTSFDLPPFATPFALLVFGHPTEQQKARKKPTHFTTEDLVQVDRYRRRSPEELRRCFEYHCGSTGDAFDHWVTAFAKRKFFCDFRAEMNRSCQQLLRLWTEKQK